MNLITLADTLILNGHCLLLYVMDSKLHGQLELLVIQLKRDVRVEEDKLTSYALLCIQYCRRIQNID